MQALEQKALNQSLSLKEAWDQARLTAEVIGDREAIPLLESVLKTQGDHVYANYLLGSILIAQKDITGIPYLEVAMKKDSDVFLSGCELIYNFFKQQHNESQANRYIQRAEEHYKCLAKAQEERSTISVNDQFKHHELAAKEVTYLQEQFLHYPEIQEVFLVQKKVKYFPEKPLYVLGVIRRISFWETDKKEQENKLLKRLFAELDCPKSTIIIILNNNQPLQKLLIKVADRPIYQGKK